MVHWLSRRSEAQHLQSEQEFRERATASDSNATAVDPEPAPQRRAALPTTRRRHRSDEYQSEVQRRQLSNQLRRTQPPSASPHCYHFEDCPSSCDVRLFGDNSNTGADPAHRSTGEALAEPGDADLDDSTEYAPALPVRPPAVPHQAGVTSQLLTSGDDLGSVDSNSRAFSPDHYRVRAPAPPGGIPHSSADILPLLKPNQPAQSAHFPSRSPGPGTSAKGISEISVATQTLLGLTESPTPLLLINSGGVTCCRKRPTKR